MSKNVDDDVRGHTNGTVTDARTAEHGVHKPNQKGSLVTELSIVVVYS
jgi:hypothetical protein